MSLPIWTPDALSCELRLYEGLCWRLVEAQHRVSTMKLVASLEEQALLSCRAFSTSAPCERQTWYLHFSAAGVRAVCDHPREAIEFGADHFGADPRIRAMRWDRGSGTP